MKSIWITYSRKDNEEGDVDFIAQQLQRSGLRVELDRWELTAGRRLWEQIENKISDEGRCNAWLMIATNNSLSSEKCKEEYAYALDRALNSRGPSFPVIALFFETVDESLIPAGIKTRTGLKNTSA